MKDRILAYLHAFTQGDEQGLATELKKELGLDDNTFLQHVHDVRSEILHHYAQFSISTIDAFFQKVIRAFTRESGLIGDYRLEVDQDDVMEDVINNLIDELGSNDELTNWVVEFAKENLENEKAWDIRKNLADFSRELFKEDFKRIEEDFNRAASDRSFFKKFRESLWEKKNFFLNHVSKLGREALKIIDDNGLKPFEFSHGERSGLFTFLRNNAYERKLSEFDEPGVRVRSHFTFAKNWPSSKTRRAKEIVALAEERLIPIVNELVAFHDKHYVECLSAEVTLRNMYVFGLLSDISRKLTEYKSDNNMMLLSDAPKFLDRVISDSDTPFIYEKVGSFYRNYLIDEFQDTSGFQWKNFLPLLTNSLDQGYPSLIVGDVKQAIYRWRGGDLNLLQKEVEGHIGKDRVGPRELDRNFRSSPQVVSFNNQVFKAAANIAAAETGAPVAPDVYRDIAQEASKSEEGFVSVQFFKDEEDRKWKDIALANVPKVLERLQEQGAALKDIAILVRKNEEGQRIAAHLLQYKTSTEAKASCKYDVVSNESLRIDGATTVRLLHAAMQYLFNTDDAIARALLGYEFAQLHEPDRSLKEVFAVSHQVNFENNLPPGFTREKLFLRKLPLFELTETLIEIFKLGEVEGELIYLNAFQDVVLEFYSRERNDLGAFLEWWEENKRKKSIKVSGEIDAAQIITIHMSKGLQFRYVIIPFCSWNLDHDSFNAPTLWVKSDVEPYKNAGYLPVPYSGTLKKTYFEAPYQEERTKCYLDNLNVLYVAFTRAEEGLIITAPHPSAEQRQKTVGGLLHRTIQSDEGLMQCWDEGAQQWRLGTLSQRGKAPSLEREGVGLTHYPVSRWREKLVIRQSGSAYFKDTLTDDHKKSISFGIQMHAVLSRIRYEDEIAASLDQIVGEGLITEGEKESLGDQLKELLNDKRVASWYSKVWDVRTEVPILLPGGNENRIDRLMIREADSGRQAVVVDFKTGVKSSQDQRQVLEYMNILRSMNFVSVEGYLVYLNDREVVEVKAGGKQKVVKKKEDNQLGLGF